MYARLLSCLSLAAILIITVSCSGQPLKDFSSDGCSLFPDGTLAQKKLWCECCERHDLAYWQGGGKDQRKQADLALRDCVLEKTGNQVLADTMYHGIRVGGSPAFPTWYRWGYGWKYGRGYHPLSFSEKAMVKKKLSQYKNSPRAYRCD